MAKLKDILSEVFDESPKVDRHQVVEGVETLVSLENHFIIVVTLWK